MFTQTHLSSPVRARRAPVAITLFGLAAGIGLTTMAGVPASAQDPLLREPVDCPTALPTSEAVDGMEGTGWTVERGTTPEPFTATVLGRIDDGIAPGYDMIIADLDSPALARAGGVWAGMSGSPVYTADGRLIGSVSYGLTSASSIAGITPADSLASLLGDDPDDAPPPPRSSVPVPRRAAKRVAATGEASFALARQGFRALPEPFTVSGVPGVRPGSGAERLANRLRRQTGMQVMVGGASAPAVAAPADEIVGGGNFAAAVSYGFVTLSAVGTTTYTCEGRAVAFGHPFLDEGVVTYSVHPATAVLVQPDPVFGPFKVANLGGVAGTVDRDRTVGIRGVLGRAPTTTTITSEVTRTTTGGQTTGTTYATYDAYTPTAAAYHALYTVDKAMGSAWSPGSFRGTLRVTGTRPNGAAFSVRIREAFATPSTSDYPLDYQVADWAYFTLSALLQQPFDSVRLSTVSLKGTVSSDGAYWRKPALRVRQHGRYVAPAHRTLDARAGGRMRWKATAPLYQQPDATQTRRATLRVPARFAGRPATVAVYGGQQDFWDTSASSFPALLAALAEGPSSDELRVELRVRGRNQPVSIRTMRFDRVLRFFGANYRVRIR